MDRHSLGTTNPNSAPTLHLPRLFFPLNLQLEKKKKSVMISSYTTAVSGPQAKANYSAQLGTTNQCFLFQLIRRHRIESERPGSMPTPYCRERKRERGKWGGGETSRVTGSNYWLRV